MAGVGEAVRKANWLALVVLSATSCRGSTPAVVEAGTSGGASGEAEAAVVFAEGGTTETGQGDAGVRSAEAPWPRLMSDQELGALSEKLSEKPGDFPSDNFVSNETSYLDVVPALRKEGLKGKAYIGVGPEQNLTYLAILNPAIAYIVDIRRGNLLEHLVLRGCFEAADNRVQFVAALTAREAPASLAGKETTCSAAEIAQAFASAPAKPELRDQGVERTRALAARLGIALKPNDITAIRGIHQEFFRKGLELAYSMKGSGRRYPTVGALLAQTTAEGEPASFLGTEQSWQRVKNLESSNRVVPVVGDFLGEGALQGIATDLRARGLVLGVFYTSNVEQYLFEEGKYVRFVANVKAQPLDSYSLLLRVWFDQGRKHPQQREGHRTTSLTMSTEKFLERAGKRPWRSYWEVATEPQ